MVRMNTLGVAVRLAFLGAGIVAAAAVSNGAVEIPGIRVLSSAIAYTAALTLGVLGVPASLDGAFINADGFLAVIAAECTAIELILVFSAGVLVSPAPLRERGWALLLGIPALCLLNLVRVITLLLAGIAIPHHFDTLHFDLWQPVMAIAALTLWLLWFWRTRQNMRGTDLSNHQELAARP